MYLVSPKPKMPKRNSRCMLPGFNIAEGSRVLTDMDDFIIFSGLGPLAGTGECNGGNFFFTLFKGLSQLG